MACARCEWLESLMRQTNLLFNELHELATEFQDKLDAANAKLNAIDAAERAEFKRTQPLYDEAGEFLKKHAGTDATSERG